jgi:hypothetical protein
MVSSFNFTGFTSAVFPASLSVLAVPSLLQEVNAVPASKRQQGKKYFMFILIN